MRFARSALVALLVLLFAVTPLSAFLSGGNFETWLGGSYDRPLVRIAITDHTGLVRQVTRAEIDSRGGGPVINPEGNRRVLVVQVWGACGDFGVRMSFHKSSDGYVLHQKNQRFGFCLSGMWGHGSVALILWAPVDAATVRLDSPYGP